MEDETASFSAYFDDHAAQQLVATLSLDARRDVQAVVLPLHDESLQLLSAIARLHGVSGTTEYMRSVALQISLDRFTTYCREHGGEVAGRLHLSAGPLKDRALTLFADTLDGLTLMERDLRCSETILLETAIRQSAEAHGVDRQPV